MAATTDQLAALAQDQLFRQRVRNLVLVQAGIIAGEVNTTPNHAARTAFAFKLLGAPALADQIADVLCGRTNLTASTVTYDFTKRAVVTDATDAAITSQLQTDWNILAGVAT